MNSLLVYLVIVAVFAETCSAANLTVASATDAYVALWNRKYQNDINTANSKVECVDARGADSIRIMKDQQEEIIKEIIRYEDSLIPVEALSVIRRHCIQKHKVMLITQESATAQFQSCIATAQSRVNSLTTSAKTSVANARTLANINLPKALVSCNTTYFNNSTKKEECIISTMDSYTSSLQAYMRSVDKNLDASLCTSVDLSRDSIQCAFSVQRNVLVTIGKVTSLIETCMKETETVCPCAKNLMVESGTPNTRNLLSDMVPKNRTSS